MFEFPTPQFDQSADLQSLKTVIDQAVRLMKADSGGIYHYDSLNQELILIASFSTDDDKAHLYGTKLKVGEGAAGRLILSDELFSYIPDYANWKSRSPLFSPQTFGSVIEMRLEHENKRLGILYINNNRVGHEYSTEEIDLLSVCCNYAGLILHNINQLRKEIRQRNRVEKVLHANHEVMSNFTDFELATLRERFNHIVYHVTEILEAETCGYFVVEGNNLVLEASYGNVPNGELLRRQFRIIDGKKTGLTGAIAARGQLFNEYGDKLVSDPAVKGDPPHTPAGKCYSLLMYPLKLKPRYGDESRIVAWLRVDNKKDSNNKSGPNAYFTDDDVNILRQFADTVTATLSANELLQELDQLFSIAPNPIVEIDPNGKIVRMNSSAQEITGRNIEDLQGQSVNILYSQENEANKIGQLLREQGTITKHHTSIRNKSGLHIPIRLTASNLYDARGQRKGSVGYLEDMRERTLLRHLIDTAQVYIYAKDLEGRFIAANTETALRLGVVHPKNLIGTKDSDYFVDEELIRIYSEAEQEAIDTGIAVKVEEPTRDLSNGEARWLSTIKTPLFGFDGKVVGVVGVGQDITERHKRQAKIEKLFNSSSDLLSADEPDKVLRTLVNHIHEAEEAQAVKLILINDFGEDFELFTAGDFKVANPDNRIRSAGISLHVKETGKDVIIRDTNNPPRLLNPDIKANNIKSALCLPVTSRQKTIGAIWIHYEKLQRFDPEDIQIIKLYLNQAAITYGLLQQLQHENAVAEISPEITQSENALWNEIVQKAYNSLNAHEVRVYRFNGLKNEFFLNPIVKGHVEWSPSFSHFKIVNEIAERRSTLAVSRITGVNEDNHLYSLSKTVKSYMVAPVRHKDDEYPLGVIFVSYLKPRIFYQEDVLALDRFTERAALILYNSNLHEKIAHQQRQLHHLQEASELIVKSNDSISMLYETARQAVMLIAKVGELPTNTSFSYIGLVKDSQTLEFVASYPEERLEWLQDALQRKLGEHPMNLQNGQMESRGISTHVVREGKLQVVNDVLQENNYLRLDENTGSQLSVPLRSSSGVLGVLTVEHHELNAFSEEDADRVQTLADLVAIAIDRLRRLDQNTEIFGLLAKVTKLRGDGEGTEHNMLHRITEAIQQILKCDVVSLYIFDQITGQKVVLGAIVGEKHHRPRLSEPYEDSSFVVQVLKKGNLELVNDASDFYIKSSFMRAEKIRSFIAVPLEATGQQVGVIFISYRVSKSLESEIADIQQLSVPVAVAIQYVQLLAKERHLWSRLNKIHDITDKISQGDTLKDIAGEILDSLRQFIEYDKATIQLIQGDRRQLLHHRNLDEKSISQYLLRPVSQDKLVHRILESGKTTILSDLTDEETRKSWDWEVFPETENVRSWIGIPLIFGGDENRKPVGFLTLDHAQPGYYQVDNVQLVSMIEIFAQQAAIAIKKAQLNNDLKVLNDIGRQLTVIKQTHEIPHLVYRLTSRLMDTSDFFLGIYNLLTNQVDIKVWYHHGEIRPPASYTIQGFTKYILETGKSFLVRDFDQEADTLPVQPAIITERQRSWLGVPMFSPITGTTIGILSTQSREQNAFDDNNRDLLQIIAQWTAIALENAQLFETIHHQNPDQIEALREIASTSTNVIDEQRFYDNIIGWCEMLMHGAELVEIRLIDSVTNELVTQASNNSAVKPEFIRSPIGRGVTSWVAKNGKPRLVENISQISEEYLAFVDGMHSELALPIFDSWSNVIGVLNIEHTEVNAFESSDVAFAQALAGLLGVAIENRYLNHRLREAQITIAEQERGIVLESIEADLIHKIRNLAGPIIPRIKLIRDLLAHQVIQNNEINTFLDEIVEDTRRILREGTDLKDLLGRSTLLDLKILVGNIVAQTELMAPQVRFEYKTDSGLPTIRGDERQLSTAIFNVVHNAIKSVQNQRKPLIHIDVAIIHDVQGVPSGVNITIADNGIGITGNERARIFEYGFTRWKDGQGSGYGLWRSQTIVANFGGSITLENSPFESGTCFIIFLPSTPETSGLNVDD